MAISMAAIIQLPIQQRLEAVEVIWASIVADPMSNRLPISDAHRHELDVRLDAHARNPKASTAWETLRDRLRGPR